MGRWVELFKTLVAASADGSQPVERMKPCARCRQTPIIHRGNITGRHLISCGCASVPVVSANTAQAAMDSWNLRHGK